MEWRNASQKLPSKIMGNEMLTDPRSFIECRVHAKYLNDTIAGVFIKSMHGIEFKIDFYAATTDLVIHRDKFNNLIWLDEYSDDGMLNQFCDSTHTAISVLRTMLKKLNLDLGVEAADHLLSKIEQKKNSIGKHIDVTRSGILEEIFSVCERVPMRTKYGVLASIMSEAGELADEVAIREGQSYKQPDKDGILGESIDVIISAFDMIYLERPDITDHELIAIMRQKLQKWRDKAIYFFDSKYEQ